jgi:uncharacterized membrane protein
MKIGKLDVYPHPVSVHFTNALFPVAVLFLILHSATHQPSFAHTYFHTMLLATLSAPVSFVTGLIEWKQKYKGAKTPVFTKKARFGLALSLTGALCTLWCWMDSAIVSSSGTPFALFYLANLTCLGLALFVGHLGGKLVFGARQ